MSLVKKSDLKNHLSPRHRTHIHLAAPASQAGATALLGEPLGAPVAEAGGAAGEVTAQGGIATSGARPFEVEPRVKPLAQPEIARDAKA